MGIFKRNKSRSSGNKSRDWESLNPDDHLQLMEMGRPDVVGESRNQHVLRRVLRAEGRDITVLLVPDNANEYDDNAVAVCALIGSAAEQVGFLPMEDASWWGPALRSRERAGQPLIALSARLMGGEPGKPSIGVFIDWSQFNI